MAEDDSFIHEVNEEIRKDKALALWGRYGPIIIYGAVALVFGTALWQGYTYWQNNKAGNIGDSFIEASALAKSGNYDEALKTFDQIASSNFGNYPALAQLQEASIALKKGDKKAAVDIFDKVVKNSKTPDNLKNVARINAAYILIDSESFDQINERISSFNDDNNPMRLSAREILGLSAWKAGLLPQAKTYFEQIINDSNSLGSGFATRAQIMLDLINSRTQSAKG